MDKKRDTLHKVNASSEAVLYQIRSERESSLQRFILTSNQTRNLLNRPEIIGGEFRRILKKWAIQGLQLLPNAERFRTIAEHQANVLHILRGGLNFGLMDALEEGLGLNAHRASFFTSERAQDSHGKWMIQEDQYVKLTVTDDSILFLGDIVATGTTVEAGFSELCRQMLGSDALMEGKDGQAKGDGAKKRQGTLREVVFFTIGCGEIERILERYDQLFYDSFPEYQGMTIVYMEGKFHLAEEETPLALKILGTDLLKHSALLAPEFFLSQYTELSYPLESCVIYDGGSRSYDVSHHLQEVISYWKKVNDLAKNKGWTLFDALKERWPEHEFGEDFSVFASWAHSQWPGCDPELFDAIWEAYKKRWTDSFLQESTQLSSLNDVCEKRLNDLEHCLSLSILPPSSHRTIEATYSE